MTNLRLWGVSRAPDGQPTLILHFDRVPTDDEMRELHERLGSTCTCKPLAQQLGVPFGLTAVAVDPECPLHQNRSPAQK